MGGGIDRRTVVGSLVAAATVGGAVARTSLAAGAAAPLTVESLSPQTRLITGAGGNVLATRSADGLIVIDGGLAERRTAVLAALQREFGTTDIAWLFNTHWHREQTGLNETAGARKAVVCAHENTKLWLATEFYVDWQDRTYEPLPQAALPTRTFYGTREEATVGGRALRFGRLANPHTDGDVYVQLVDEDVVAVGGALTPGAYPLMDYSTGGWLGGVVEATKQLGQLATDRTRFVAATGGVVGKDALAAQAKLATTMLERLSNGIKQGKSAQDMLDEGITREFDASLGDPRFFVKSGYRGLWGHIRELGVA